MAVEDVGKDCTPEQRKDYIISYLASQGIIALLKSMPNNKIYLHKIHVHFSFI